MTTSHEFSKHNQAKKKASGKAMSLQQVPLLPSMKLNQHSGAVFDYSFLFLLASPFLDSWRIGTATFSKQMAAVIVYHYICYCVSNSYWARSMYAVTVKPMCSLINTVL